MAKVEKSVQEWKAQLKDNQFKLTRKKGTERAFTGEYWDSKAPGISACVSCDKPLFDAHPGYVFPDGPAPTGQQYCLNSAALMHQVKAESP